jgi:Transcription factor WhiB
MSALVYQNLLQALSCIPRLPGAACRNQHELFEDPDRAEEAITICQTCCPALEPCAEGADTLKHNQIDGVIAGQYRPWVSHPSELRHKQGVMAALSVIQGGGA